MNSDFPVSRTILLVAHTGRPDNVEAMFFAAQKLQAAGVSVRIADEGQALDAHGFDVVVPGPSAAQDCEMVLVLGGDGTFLRAADMAHAVDIPVLGINLGHVGFLAEWEAESLEQAIDCVIHKTYRVEERMTVDVAVFDKNGRELGNSWALNEASVASVDHLGVLDAILEVDGRPVSSFGCDGVLISTPTGSTAYAFSAGGPILWPELDAMVVVPNNAHALFTKPLVISPESEVAVESASSTNQAMVTMDGLRRIDMPAGSRVEVRKGAFPVRWVRLDSLPFADRLVSKFKLPVHGWRGPQS